MKNLVIFVAILGLIAAVPLMTIWSVNTLFTLAIPYTLSTWAGAWWLGFILGGGAYVMGRNK